MEESVEVALGLRGWAWVAACALVATGCDAFDPTLLDERAPFAVTTARDAGGEPPPSPVQDACASTTELCNDSDDDCDGKVDEDAEADCALPHAVGACASGGTCVLAVCEKGYLDCNERDRDGCEQSVAALACGACGTGCLEDGGVLLPDAGGGVQVGTVDASTGGEVDPGPAPGSPDAGVPDAATCVPQTERCNNADDDCDDKLDEAPANCALEACIASAPSYRGAACDDCACRKCGMYLDQCQNNADAKWAMLCRDVTECYVVNSRAGRCAGNEDCYGSGNGPCAAEINLASGGASGTDTSQVVSGCSVSNPPRTACAAVTLYRDECTRSLCATECAN